MTSFIVRILSSVKTAVSALKQQTEILAMAPVQQKLFESRENFYFYLINLPHDYQPQSREQTTEHGLYWHQDEEDSHSRKA